MVIAILSFLWLVWFLVLQKWMSQSRDATRLRDISIIKEALEVNYIDSSTEEIYPFPDNDNEGHYITKWEVDWKALIYKWTFWTWVVNKLSSMTKFTKDPSGERYAYAVTSNQKEFQIATILENTKKVSYNKFANTLYAWDFSSFVDWNYKKIIKYTTWDCQQYAKILNVPSLIFNNYWNINLLDNEVNYVVNNWKNYPYKISKKTKINNEGVSKIFLRLYWEEWWVTWFNISSIKDKEELKEKISEKKLKLFWNNLNKIMNQKTKSCMWNNIDFFDYCSQLKWKSLLEVSSIVAWDWIINISEVVDYIWCEVKKWEKEYMIWWVSGNGEEILLAKKKDWDIPDIWWESVIIDASDLTKEENKKKIRENIWDWEGTSVTWYVVWEEREDWILAWVLEWGKILVESKELPLYSDAYSEWTKKLNKYQVLNNESKIVEDINNNNERIWTEIRDSVSWVWWVIVWADWNDLNIENALLPEAGSTNELSKYELKYNQEEIINNIDDRLGIQITGYMNENLIIAWTIKERWDLLFISDFEGENVWLDSVNSCKSKWDNWHLAFKEELNILYKNKDKIEEKWYTNFSGDFYWSLSEYNCSESYLKNFNEWGLIWSGKDLIYKYRCVTSLRQPENEDNIVNCLNFLDKEKVYTGSEVSSNIEKISWISKKVWLEIEWNWEPKYRVCEDSACVNVVSDWWKEGKDSIGSWDYLQLKVNSSSLEWEEYNVKIKIWGESFFWNVKTFTSIIAEWGEVSEKEINGQRYKYHYFKNVWSNNFEVIDAWEWGKVDVFLVGGWGGAHSTINLRYARGGGGWGYTKTVKNITITEKIYKIIVGDGGYKVKGESSLAFDYEAKGWKAWYNTRGGDGGSWGWTGGGWENCIYETPGNGGSNGSNGWNVDGSLGWEGQWFSTREFGESNEKIYAWGWAWATCISDACQCYKTTALGGAWGGGNTSQDGVSNTWGWAGGYDGRISSPTKGGSGIVVIRYPISY